MAAASKSRSSRRPAQPKAVDVRPGTSTGYEGGEWHIQTPTSATTAGPDTGGAGPHSFRSFRDSLPSSQSFPAHPSQSFPHPGSGQSFRDSPAYPITHATYSQSSFGGNPNSNNNGVNNGSLNLPAPTGSRPGTANGGERLPPLSSLLPLPQPGLLFRRPHTAGAPPTLSLFPRPSTSGAGPNNNNNNSSMVPSSSFLGDESPFSFHVPPGQDGESTSGPGDAGSESRPASRRLSVLELCNEPGADVPSAAGGVLAGGAASAAATSLAQQQ